MGFRPILDYSIIPFASATILKEYFLSRTKPYLLNNLHASYFSQCVFLCPYFFANRWRYCGAGYGGRLLFFVNIANVANYFLFLFLFLLSLSEFELISYSILHIYDGNFSQRYNTVCGDECNYSLLFTFWLG